jgi:hypothetical protein
MRPSKSLYGRAQAEAGRPGPLSWAGRRARQDSNPATGGLEKDRDGPVGEWRPWSARPPVSALAGVLGCTDGCTTSVVAPAAKTGHCTRMTCQDMRCLAAVVTSWSHVGVLGRRPVDCSHERPLAPPPLILKRAIRQWATWQRVCSVGKCATVVCQESCDRLERGPQQRRSVQSLSRLVIMAHGCRKGCWRRRGRACRCHCC